MEKFILPKKNPNNEIIFTKFKKFVLEDSFPCVMAKTVFSSDQFDFQTYDTMGSTSISQGILSDLDRYIAKAQSQERKFYSFVATFPNLTFESEIAFETALWEQLQLLHDLDTFEWDKKVSNDPTDSEFSFSLRRQSFYLVGMHPKSSRLARQAPCPAIIFNLHSQFDELRNMGVYHKVRDKIRERDLSLQGSINPMLADFGTDREVKQYSGRAVDDLWKCPFFAKNTVSSDESNN